jgi:hypothetical protein
MNRYGYVRKEMDTLSGVRAYMVKMYLQVEMYTIFDDFIRINEIGIKNYMYQFCYCIIIFV